MFHVWERLDGWMDAHSCVEKQKPQKWKRELDERVLKHFFFDDGGIVAAKKLHNVVRINLFNFHNWVNERDVVVVKYLRHFCFFFVNWYSQLIKNKNRAINP